MRFRTALYATLISAFALLIRCSTTLIWFNKPERLYSPDSYGYERLAINILEHHVFSQSRMKPFSPDSHRTPVYPLFIAIVYKAFGYNPIAIVFIQDIVDSISTMLIYIAVLLTSTPTAGIIAAIAYAVAPLPVFQCQRLLSETLFIFFILVASLFGLKALRGQSNRWLIPCGLMLGIATLTRPIGVGIGLIWIAVLSVAMRNRPVSEWFANVVKMVLSFLVPLVPWLVRNFIIFKTLLLCTGHQLAFAYYNAAATMAYAEGIRLEEAQLKLFNDSLKDFEGMKAFRATKPEDIWQPATHDPKNTSALVKHARAIIMAHPKEALSVHIGGFVHYLFMTLPVKDLLAKFSGIKNEGTQTPIRERILRLIKEGKFKDALKIAWQERLSQLPTLTKLLWFYSLLFTLFVDVLALYSLRVYATHDGLMKWMCALCAFISVYLLAVPGPQLEPRFRAVAEPWLIMLASIGASMMRGRKHQQTT